jgi:hypothetical protein
MAAPGTFGYLVGKLDVLRVECAQCNRAGRYSVARLVAERGRDAKLTDWLSERTRDCLQKNQRGVVRACGAIMPDLSRLR